ncbi:MAG: hypothetical protein CMN29_20540 [Sandaracinus sp.]|nr:hypothetical protein [Sandaracinus sp.]
MRLSSPTLLLATSALLACGGDPKPLDVDCDDAIALSAEPGYERLDLPVRWERDGDLTRGGPVALAVPEGVTGLAFALEDPDALAGFRVAVDGEVVVDVVDLFGEGPWFHFEDRLAVLQFPMDGATAPPSGCVAVEPVLFGTTVWEEGTLHVMSRRGAGAALTIAPIVVGETAIDDATLRAALDEAVAVYADAGAPALVVEEPRALDWPSAFVDDTTDELDGLRASVALEDERTIPVLFVQDFVEPGTFGLAAGIPGPNGVLGTSWSGLVLSVDTHLAADGVTLEAALLGETLAHELGHQLGLFHTSEAEGREHDPLEDTAECPASRDADGDGELSVPECLEEGGRNVMFWTAEEGVRQRELSATQVMLLGASPVAR